MNDKTKQALTDALIDQIESAARASFRRHKSSIKGQILTAADNYDWHLLHAAYQAGIHAMRAQLADARNRAMRLADAYAVMDIETEGIKAVGPSEWLITHDSLCDELTADSIEHLRYRRLALIDDADGGLLVHLETDA